ncbi:MAG: hypothetical protein U9N02_01700 [Campylobacterota bacterium]|nr:hypothetical protein [Campylobacterota bacterium]
MIDDNEYEILKNSFIDSKRLFDKLNRVYEQYQDIEPDESGFSMEDEERLQRHWLKLSSKIVDSLGNSMDDFNIELKKNDDLNMRELYVNLIKDGEVSEIKIDYSEEDSLNITKIS